MSLLQQSNHAGISGVLCALVVSLSLAQQSSLLIVVVVVISHGAFYRMTGGFLFFFFFPYLFWDGVWQELWNPKVASDLLECQGQS